MEFYWGSPSRLIQMPRGDQPVGSGVSLLLRSSEEEALEFSIQRTGAREGITFGFYPSGPVWAQGGLTVPHWWTAQVTRHLSVASVVLGKPQGLK